MATLKDLYNSAVQTLTWSTWPANTKEPVQTDNTPKIISTAPSYKWADWNMYQTARYDNNNFWTLDSSWKLVSNYYNETQRENVKNQYLTWKIWWYNQNTSTPDLYASWIQWVQNKISQTWQNLVQATQNFNTQNIADWIRMRTWWTKDLDATISNLTDQYNKSYSDLMNKYSI